MKSLLGKETSPPPTAAEIAALKVVVDADKAVDDLGATAVALTTAKGVIDAIKTKTDNLPATAAEAAPMTTISEVGPYAVNNPSTGDYAIPAGATWAYISCVTASSGALPAGAYYFTDSAKAVNGPGGNWNNGANPEYRGGRLEMIPTYASDGTTPLAGGWLHWVPGGAGSVLWIRWLKGG